MNDNWCMDFSNSEIKEFLVDNYSLNCSFFIDDKEVDINDKRCIEWISIKGSSHRIDIYFLKSETSIFVDEEEFMFIDDNEKKHYCSSDIFDNVVYEGNLNALSHKQILTLIGDFISIFYNGQILDIRKKLMFKDKNYDKYNYLIAIKEDDQNRKEYTFDNITFTFN